MFDVNHNAPVACNANNDHQRARHVERIRQPNTVTAAKFPAASMMPTHHTLVSCSHKPDHENEAEREQQHTYTHHAAS